MGDSYNKPSLYQRAGIGDLAEFYRVRYASSELLDAQYFDPINRLDIRWSRTMWIYDNVQSGSTVLDLGCGAGVLALLKRKGVTLAGVDISSACAAAARRNGYDSAYAADLTALPFANASFDYVVSLDVMGHVEFAEKDAVLAEIKRVLRPGGVTMHGIESMNRDRRKDYEQMTDLELRHFVGIDGHVGMEALAALSDRFSRFFPHVRVEPRFSICQSAEELVKQANDYGVELCDRDLLDYLGGLSFNERRAFNMAMGYVFQQISANAISLPKSEYVLLKASGKPLGTFYNEHLNHADLFPEPIEVAPETPICLDSSSHATFNGGWYPAENLPPIGRWMGRRAKINFRATPFSKLRFDITTHIPNVSQQPLHLEFLLNGARLLACSLSQNGWRKLELDVSDLASTKKGEKHLTNQSDMELGSRAIHQAAINGSMGYELEIRADRTWQPCSTNPDSPDDRELSVALANIQVVR